MQSFICGCLQQQQQEQRGKGGEEGDFLNSPTTICHHHVVLLSSTPLLHWLLLLLLPLSTFLFMSLTRVTSSLRCSNKAARRGFTGTMNWFVHVDETLTYVHAYRLAPDLSTGPFGVVVDHDIMRCNLSSLGRIGCTYKACRWSKLLLLLATLSWRRRRLLRTQLLLEGTWNALSLPCPWLSVCFMLEWNISIGATNLVTRIFKLPHLLSFQACLASVQMQMIEINCSHSCLDEVFGTIHPSKCIKVKVHLQTATSTSTSAGATTIAQYETL